MVAEGMVERGVSIRQLARQFGVCEGALCYRLRRRARAHSGDSVQRFRREPFTGLGRRLGRRPPGVAAAGSRAAVRVAGRPGQPGREDRQAEGRLHRPPPGGRGPSAPPFRFRPSRLRARW